MIRRLLDGLYDLAGVLAAAALVGLLLDVLASIGTRLVGIAFPGATAYAGYLMATASFLALAHTFRRGAHIRVELLLQSLPAAVARWLDILATAVAAGLAWYFAWFALQAALVSAKIGDVSQGQDATPLWIPQLAMVVGTALLAVAITDHLIRRLRGETDEPTAPPVQV